MSSDAGKSKLGARARFQSTHWSQVQRAGKQSDPSAKDALESLCSTYWYPLYAFARRWGLGIQEAEDVTQGFFTEVLENGYLRSADPDRGRFRTFLLVMFKRYIGRGDQRAKAQKRGGHLTHLSIDFQVGESRYQREPTERWTAERIFDRQWGLTLLGAVTSRLRAELKEEGREQLFTKAATFLTGSREVPYAEIARELEMSPGALRVAVHRLRGRYRELLRAEILQTLDDPEEIDSEIECLRRAVSSES